MRAMSASAAKDAMLADEPYLAGDPELVADRMRTRRLCERFNAVDATDLASRAGVLGELLGSIGDGTEILSPFHCDYGYQIEIGARSFVNFGAVILDSARVRIGADVQIGPGAHLVTPNHPLDADARRTGLEHAAPITISDDAWLAARVTVLPGVTIGSGAVIGAGSVVTGDMPARHLCFGNPCRAIRPI
jgi:maltose O-acetyltransferase